MNVKYLIPFVEAAYEVLKSEIKVQMQRGDLKLEKGAYTTDDVTVIISLVGDVEGIVLYSMSRSTALNIASAMLGDNLDDLNNLAQSGIAELGNVITGRASVKLAHTGFESTISPPTLLLGKGGTVNTLDFARVVVPLEGDPGSMLIHLALREAAQKGTSAAHLKVPSAPKVS